MRLEYLLGVGCYGVVLLAILGIVLMFFLALHRCLAECRPENRAMEPGLVWLNLVPVLNLIFPFITVAQIGSSLRREYKARGLTRKGTYGAALGWTWLLTIAATGVLCFFAQFLDEFSEAVGIPLVGFLVLGFLLSFGLGIAYWTVIGNFTTDLKRNPGGFDEELSEGGYRDFDENYRPIPRRRRERVRG